MHRRDDPVARRELLVRDVKRSVGADVDLDAFENVERRDLLVERVDLHRLQMQQVATKALRVVADGVVRVPARAGRRDHRLERVLAVGPRRVRVQVAAEVAELDELRQLAAPRRLQLAGVLAELGRDPLVTEEAVDLGLGREAMFLARLDLRHGVLRHGEPAAHGILSQRDVVVLRTGEVLQQVAVALRRNDAEIEAQPVVRHDRRLRRPFAATSTTQGCVQKWSTSAGASVAVAMMSRSRTVSRMRRAEPA